MDGEERTASNLELIGGRLCLDFANTVSTRGEAERREYLSSYEELVRWGQHTSILEHEAAEMLLCHATRHPELAAAALERALGLRETIYRVFSAIAEGREAGRRDLGALDAVLRQALCHLKIAPSQSGFDWAWDVEEDDLDQILWPIARSAADLLTSEDVGLVGQCAREGCDWLFVDLSKNRSRRWCTMAVCGSRVKARRYYQRKREKEQVG
jgi:predicted RNA-binding Zn ribbon-like protein